MSSPGTWSGESTTRRAAASARSGSRATRSSPGRLSSPPTCQRSEACSFTAEAVRQRHENLGLIRSRYRQPFGTFSGELLPGIGLADGYGVMEQHDVYW